MSKNGEKGLSNDVEQRDRVEEKDDQQEQVAALNASVESVTIGTDMDGDALSNTTFFARRIGQTKYQSYDDMFSDDEDHAFDKQERECSHDHQDTDGEGKLSAVALIDLEKEVARRHAQLLSMRML